MEECRELSIIRMLRQMVPHHEAEVLCLILFSMPAQIKHILERNS